MDLARHQRQLLSLIKGAYDPTADDDVYLQQVAASRNLALVREIATWWRLFDVERYCVLTSRLLKQRGVYDVTVDSFVRTHAISPYINELGENFLMKMSQSDDRLLAAVAQTELALTRVKRGDRRRYTVEWDYHPAVVLTALAKESMFDVDSIRGCFKIVVAWDLPELLAIEVI